MNVVLVCVGNFQEYILVNIKQLILLKHKKIYVITDSVFFDRFFDYKNDITLVDADGLDDPFKYNPSNKIDNSFRNGFWSLTSRRLFLLSGFMKKYNVTDVIHIENDVLIYYNCDILYETIDKDRICVPADCYRRSIASIIYIPNFTVFGLFLNQYNNELNDMQNLSIIQRQFPLLFDNFPICVPLLYFTNEQKYVCRQFNKFKMIFDAAAMGQMVGGIDPRNTPGNTIGFINETSVIKYNNYDFVWCNFQDNIRKPYLKVDGNMIPIFNLHIHSKNLIDFV